MVYPQSLASLVTLSGTACLWQAILSVLAGDACGLAKAPCGVNGQYIRRGTFPILFRDASFEETIKNPGNRKGINP